MSSPPKLEPRISVLVSGEERTIFMSFGLLNELASLVGGPEAVPKLSFDPVVATAALESMLAKRDKHGKPIPQDDPYLPEDMDPQTAERLIDWAATHVLDFFVRRFAKSAALFASQAEELAAVGSSLSSSANSAGKTPLS